MTYFKDLPEEVLLLIFEEIDPAQLFQLETICKKWKDVLRSYTSPWTKGIELDCRAENPEEEKKLRAVLTRSRGEIQAWKVTVYDSTLAFYQNLFNLIPTSKVRSLQIELLRDENIVELSDNYDSDNSDASDDRGYRIDQIHLQRRKDCAIAVRAIHQCSNLRLLDISAAFDLDFSLGSDFKLTPLAKCRLESLSLTGIDLDELFEGGSIFNMVSEARHIDISGYGTGTDIDVVRLIEAAKDTLETCSVPLSGRTQHGETFRSITFPRLQQLKILGGQYPTFPIQYSLSCPNLHYLDLQGMLPSALCANLLTDSVTVLRLGLSEQLCHALETIYGNAQISPKYD